MTPPRVAFLAAATWHGSPDDAERILAAHPDVAGSDVHTAAVLGDADAVRRCLDADPANATVTSEPYGGDALTCLCLSKYLRLDAARTDGFLRAATMLLDAGADPNTGFWTTGDHPEYESALYGAAGVAHHAGLTRLLLARGADPNDVEVVYHAPEGYDSGAMQAVVETGALTPDSLACMLIRKADCHDEAGIRYLLRHGADPNHRRDGWDTAVQHAVMRDNDLPHVEAMLEHGGDPALVVNGRSAIQMAARRGRKDLLDRFERRGIPLPFDGLDRLVAACARHDAHAARAIAEREPALVRDLVDQGGRLLAEFAGTWNTEGVRMLLDLGVHVDARYEGDGYFEIAPDSTALHVAAWKAHPPTVKLLLARGAAVDVRDAKGRTPLRLAVRACVDSYWTERRSPESIAALLDAGASADGIEVPTGYDEADALLADRVPEAE